MRLFLTRTYSKDKIIVFLFLFKKTLIQQYLQILYCFWKLFQHSLLFDSSILQYSTWQPWQVNAKNGYFQNLQQKWRPCTQCYQVVSGTFILLISYGISENNVSLACDLLGIFIGVFSVSCSFKIMFGEGNIKIKVLWKSYEKFTSSRTNFGLNYPQFYYFKAEPLNIIFENQIEVSMFHSKVLKVFGRKAKLQAIH